MATEFETEGRRRRAMWSDLLAEGGPNRVQPSLLRKLRIYGGAQGIWVDRKVTSSVAEKGVTVGLLHTGLHYPDELDEDGVIYHYPETKRTGRRDDAEVTATTAPEVARSRNSMCADDFTNACVCTYCTSCDTTAHTTLSRVVQLIACGR